jgi:hypothetical protein
MVSMPRVLNIHPSQARPAPSKLGFVPVTSSMDRANVSTIRVLRGVSTAFSDGWQGYRSILRGGPPRDSYLDANRQAARWARMTAVGGDPRRAGDRDGACRTTQCGLARSAGCPHPQDARLRQTGCQPPMGSRVCSSPTTTSVGFIKRCSHRLEMECIALISVLQP